MQLNVYFYICLTPRQVSAVVTGPPCGGPRQKQHERWVSQPSGSNSLNMWFGVRCAQSVTQLQMGGAAGVLKRLGILFKSLCAEQARFKRVGGE